MFKLMLTGNICMSKNHADHAAAEASKTECVQDAERQIREARNTLADALAWRIEVKALTICEE